MRAIVDRFVSRINDAGIPWCHWKSNEHIGAGLDGDTDLDLLFPVDRRSDVEQLLKSAGYVRFRTPAHRTYPHIVDYLALAEETGQLVHLQCHYALTLGEEHMKSYVLPWGEEILSRRVPWDGDARVATAEAADELLLLIVRGALKLRWRDRFRYRGGRTFGGPDFQREFAWLKARVDAGTFHKRAATLLGDPYGVRMRGIYHEGATLENMGTASRDLRRSCRQRGWRRLGVTRALARRWYNEAVEAVACIQRRLAIRRPWIMRRRVRDGRGVIVPIIGVDGSGKSSITRAVVSDWRNRIDVEVVYFGTGDGPKSLLFRAASFAARLGRSRKREGPPGGDFAVIGWQGVLRAVLTARQKRKVMDWALFLRDRGVVVVCDRYPQNQLTGFNDGPHLTSLVDSPSPLRRAAARYETRIFERLAAVSPDTAVRLKPSITAALERKNGETPRAILERKLEEMMRLEFPVSRPVLAVDADMPFDSVLNQVKRHIWQVVAK